MVLAARRSRLLALRQITSETAAVASAIWVPPNGAAKAPARKAQFTQTPTSVFLALRFNCGVSVEIALEQFDGPGEF